MTEKEKRTIPQYNIEGVKDESFLGSPGGPGAGDHLVRPRRGRSPSERCYQSLGKDSKLAYTTIMTTMNRLFEKDLLDREVEERQRRALLRLLAEDGERGVREVGHPGRDGA